jgi:hypothetical protein
MGWLTDWFKKEEVKTEDAPQRMHCIRFMTERGEQLGMLLTTEEFQRAVQRWVDTIDEMPIETADPNNDEQIP